MGRIFPLAGLLRLRRLQEEDAASQLAAANSRVRDNLVVQARARRTLEGVTSEPTDIATMRSIAAARASSSAMLADLRAVAVQYRHTAGEAESGYHAARSKTAGIEKLDGRHTAATEADDLRVEQNALDEIASMARERRSRGTA